MTKYRKHLPQLDGGVFLTDGGLETTLIYQKGFELPSFAAFTLLNNPKGRQGLKDYFATYAALGAKYGVGMILETATWRANPDWAAKLGYDDVSLRQANQDSVKLLQEIRAEHETPKNPVVISGCIGPRGDGYQPDKLMDAEDAETYHQPQIKALAEAGVDLITAITMNYIEEPIGIVWAARAAGLPVVVSFTVETDGKLPTGNTLEEAIEDVDEATDNAVAYYMINCAHPTHFADTLDPSQSWTKRIRGLRVNASQKSHAELDKATELDAGNPPELGTQCAQLRGRWPELNVLGGCCGTDERHVEEMVKASLAVDGART